MINNLFLYVIMNLGFFVLFLGTREKLTFRALTYLTDFNDYARVLQVFGAHHIFGKIVGPQSIPQERPMQ